MQVYYIHVVLDLLAVHEQVRAEEVLVVLLLLLRRRRRAAHADDQRKMCNYLSLVFHFRYKEYYICSIMSKSRCS
jgi:hypothetical protein